MPKLRKLLFLNGADDPIRTGDPLITSEIQGIIVLLRFIAISCFYYPSRHYFIITIYHVSNYDNSLVKSNTDYTTGCGRSQDKILYIDNFVKS